MNIIETFTTVIRTQPGEKLLSRFVVIETKNNAFVKTKQRNEQLARELNWDGSAFQTISARFYFTKRMLQELNMKTNKQKQTSKQNTKTQKETMMLWADNSLKTEETCRHGRARGQGEIHSRKRDTRAERNDT